MNNNTTLRQLLAASSLALACLSAPAATVNYAGVVDSGPLSGSAFSGSFSYADPSAAFDGSVDLDAFTLDFNGQTYTLASGDLPAVAWFAGGSFLGVDYLDLDSFGTAVQLTAGFFDLSEALFSYQVGSTDQGLGGFTEFTTVPEPTSAALLLVGLGLLSASRRRSAA
jgi:hypothetical protein